MSYINIAKCCHLKLCASECTGWLKRVLSPEVIMHDDAYIGRRPVNNIKCIVHDDIG